MKHSSEFGRQKFALSPTDAGERIGVFLKRLYPERTAENVAADLGPWDIKSDRIAAMLQRQTSPGWVLGLALIWAYGPDFLSEVHPAPLGWLSQASRDQKREALEARMTALKIEMDRL